MAQELYATCLESADIAGIETSDIGIPENNYVRKIDLVESGKFDVSYLQDYSDNDFILLKDVVRGSFIISVAIEQSALDRGQVQINGGSLGSSAELEVDIDTPITVKCVMNNSGDVFDGWYEDGMKMSTSLEYSFLAKKEVSLTAKILYMDLSQSSLQFASSGGTLSITVSSNTGFTIS